MSSRIFFFAMTMATMSVVFIMANTVAAATDDRVRFHDSDQFSEAGPLDKNGTTGGQEKDNGSQTLYCKALASRVSFGAERTGFEPADQLPGHGFSKPALSTTQPPLQLGSPGTEVAPDDASILRFSAAAARRVLGRME